MLKIGVLGAGHLGKIHIKCILQLPDYELVGFYDPNPEVANQVSAEMNLKRFENLHDLIESVDVVDIVTPTLSHFECAVFSLKKLKHIFIEKPLTNTIKEAEELLSIAREANVKVQVGHVERFNPAFTTAKKYPLNPMFIEAHRLSTFNPRGTDVSIVLDLMIHDIDIILSLVKSDVKNISASGVSVVSSTPDIANARIEFTNGCVANLTASRLSLKNMRKTRLFQRDSYISIDFLEKKTEIFRLFDTPQPNLPMAMAIDLGAEKGQKIIAYEAPEIPPTNAILMELKSFADAINNNHEPPVTIQDGYKALLIANNILDKIDKNINAIHT